MDLKQIIISQKEECDLLLAKSYVPREGLTSARATLKNDLIKVIVGPRRAGKSVFALQMLKGLNCIFQPKSPPVPVKVPTSSGALALA